MRSGEADDAVTGPAQRRIDTEDRLVNAGLGDEGRLQSLRGNAARAADATLQLLELLRSDAHAGCECGHLNGKA